MNLKPFSPGFKGAIRMQYYVQCGVCANCVDLPDARTKAAARKQAMKFNKVYPRLGLVCEDCLARAAQAEEDASWIECPACGNDGSICTRCRGYGKVRA